MTTLRLLLAFLALILILPAQQWERELDDDPAARQAWFHSQRAYPAASIPPGARRNALLQIARTDALARSQRQASLAAATGQLNRTVAAIDSANWTLIGPRPTDGGTARATSGAAVLAFNTSSGGGASNATSFTIGPPPQTASNAFVNAANPAGGSVLAPRSIASLFGANLAPQIAVADVAPPLPATLGGVTMRLP